MNPPVPLMMPSNVPVALESASVLAPRMTLCPFTPPVVRDVKVTVEPGFLPEISIVVLKSPPAIDTPDDFSIVPSPVRARVPLNNAVDPL